MPRRRALQGELDDGPVAARVRGDEHDVVGGDRVLLQNQRAVSRIPFRQRIMQLDGCGALIGTQVLQAHLRKDPQASGPADQLHGKDLGVPGPEGENPAAAGDSLGDALGHRLEDLGLAGGVPAHAEHGGRRLRRPGQHRRCRRRRLRETH